MILPTIISNPSRHILIQIKAYNHKKSHCSTLLLNMFAGLAGFQIQVSIFKSVVDIRWVYS